MFIAWSHGDSLGSGSVFFRKHSRSELSLCHPPACAYEMDFLLFMVCIGRDGGVIDTGVLYRLWD